MIELKECVEILDSKRIPLSSSERKRLKKIYPYYGAQGIIDYVENYIFDGEYILIAEDGNNLKSLQQNIATWVEGKFWVNNHAHILGKKKGYNLRYIYYLLSILDLRGYITGSAQPKLNQENLAGIQLQLPNINRQNKVAQILSCIDNKIEINSKINSELEEMAKTIYDYWFLQFEFPNEEGKPYKTSGGKMVWNEELKRKIPYMWTCGQVCDLGEIVAGGTPSTKHDDYYTKYGIAWITPYDLSNTNDKYIAHGERDITEKGLRNSSAKLMPKGTVLLTSRAPIGYLGIAVNELCTNQGFKSIVPNEKYGSEFIYYTIYSMLPLIKSLGTGSTFTEISKEVVSNIKIVLPNQNVIRAFEKVVQPMAQQREILEKENQELTSLRDFLLPLLMNGQVSFKE